MKSVKHQVWYQVINQVYNRVYDHIDDQVCDHIHLVSDQVIIQVFWSQVILQIRKDIK